MVNALPAPDEALAWATLATVGDPEIPVLSILELGIVRAVAVHGNAVSVTVTPTYSGCPATELINHDICKALRGAGFTAASVNIVLAPAWSSAWISAAGRAKMLAYGIVPPAGAEVIRFHPPRLACPRCGSAHTEQLSAFGATACKALHRCLDCREPFEYFKPI